MYKVILFLSFALIAGCTLTSNDDCFYGPKGRKIAFEVKRTVGNLKNTDQRAFKKVPPLKSEGISRV